MAQFVTYNDEGKPPTLSQRIGQYGLLRIVNIASLVVLIGAIPLTLTLSSRPETITQHASQITPRPSSYDNQPPIVALSSFQNGASVTAGGALTLEATASDNEHVARVEFSVNGTQECIVTTAPYTCLWRVPPGKGVAYIISVRAYDKANNPGSTSVGVVAQ